MPNGLVHGGITLTTGAATAVPVAYFIDPLLALPWLAGNMAGLILSPDLDVDRGFRGFHLVNKYFGKLIGLPWRWYWWPYGKMFKHRGISHCPIIGTATRLIYFVPCWPLFWFFGDQLWLWVAVAGLAHSDIWHWLADKLDKATGGNLL